MILVQSNTERTLPHHFDCATALYGAIENGESYRLTSIEEIQSGKLNNLLRTNLAVGSTDFMRAVFEKLGIKNVRLPRNSNRESKIMTLKEAHEYVAAGNKIFIKPYDEIKLFTGLVLDGMKYSCLNGLPDDTKVLAYEVFDRKIESEWRIYVQNHKMVDARNYSGDYCMMFNSTYVNKVIHLNRNDFPSAYTVDVGVLKDRNYIFENINSETIVVEYNDMWAIGNYGVPNDIYLKLLKERYFELIRNEQN